MVEAIDPDILTTLAQVARSVKGQIVAHRLLSKFKLRGLGPKRAEDINTILQVVVCGFAESIEESGKVIGEKDKVIEEKDKRLQEKDVVIEEKDKRLQEKDKRLLEKDVVIKMAREAADMAMELNEIKRIDPRQKWGTVTGAHAWRKLEEEKRVTFRKEIERQQHLRRKALEEKFSDLNASSWEKEPDMYPGIIKAIKDGLYYQTDDVLVVDTSQRQEFRADISIASYSDARFVYTVRYFLELKLPKVHPLTAEFRGQIVDYLQDVSEKQPHRSQFLAILSNFAESYVFVATYDQKGLRIDQYFSKTLVDAVIFAEMTPASWLKVTMPPLDSALGQEPSVLAAGKRHFLFAVTKIQPPRPRHTSAQGQIAENTPTWNEPTRHREQRNRFVLKMAHDQSPLSHEVEILEKLRDVPCPHLPELVWTRGNTELGIMPVGEPILPGQSQLKARKIVRGMIEGLKHLHTLGIIHRDIRLVTNLILKSIGSNVNVVIIDYETAVDVHSELNTVSYSGGYICWPRRLLETKTELYLPEPVDDLFASILVVLHLLFPSRFEVINAKNIQAQAGDEANNETERVLRMWRDIESSRIWGPFYKAVERGQYDELLKMSEVFCHV